MTRSTPLRVAVLLSGSGTTLQNFVDRIGDGRMRAQIVLVVSSKADAFGLERARRTDLPTLVVDRKASGSVEAFGRSVFAACREAGAELVCMAGFLQLIHVPE